MSEHLLNGLFGAWQGDPFAVRLWDGTQWRATADNPRFVIVVREPAALAELATADVEAIGEAYVAGALDVEGDLLACYPVLDFLVARGSFERLAAPRSTGAARGFEATREPQSIARAREAVNFHYELPGEFFALFLDPERVYTCAYFTSETLSLEEAQLCKLEHVCRKLRLRRDDEVLDLGCGWGAFALYAAREHGARVTAITLSELQAGYARKRIADAGLTERCRVVVMDLRELAGSARFDKIASMGSVEHIGATGIAAYFARCFELLRPGGLMLNDGMTSRPTRPLAGGNAFQRKYIFPDHALLPVSTMLSAAEAADFEVRDVESLREHYGLTLASWYRRLEAQTAKAHAIVGEPTTRAFKAYLAGTSHQFRIGDLDMHQSLLEKSVAGSSCLPLTRDDLHRSRT